MRVVLAQFLRVVVAGALAIAVAIGLVTAIGIVLMVAGELELADGFGFRELLASWLVCTALLLALSRLAYLALTQLVDVRGDRRGAQDR